GTFTRAALQILAVCSIQILYHGCTFHSTAKQGTLKCIATFYLLLGEIFPHKEKFFSLHLQ
ncbi:MAG TPA: hypothetical protein DCZ91_07890, partial [Lachnospiraceae bacterium]|nr:hypothetical protein [Lachnospiraceae bacterium]